MGKKVWWVIIFFISLYGIGTYIYFSLEPAFKDYCPIIMPDQAPFVLEDPDDPSHYFKTINDASCLNQTRVYDIIIVKTIDDISNALKIACEKKLHISIAGVRHSMGGQAFFTDALVLDMTHFNRIIQLDEEKKILTVQSGATWHDIQIYLNGKGLAIKAMQSIDIFTVGGSLSVNAHGMDHIIGSMGSTIRSFTLMFADGTIQKITPETNPQLFYAAIGGYGLFGIILEVELKVTDNTLYQQERFTIPYQDFPTFVENALEKKQYGLLYGHLSTSPFSFMEEMLVYTYKPLQTTAPFAPIRKVSLIKIRRFLLNLSKIRQYAQVFKWIAEKYIDPVLTAFQNKAIISRNEVMHDSVEYIENIIFNETDILQEYFIPIKNFNAYIKEIREVLKKNKIPLLHAVVRMVNKEAILLNYAPENMFAVVLYLNQKVSKSALSDMQQLTHDLINITLKFQGTFFLPYQLYFTKEQLLQAYPSLNTFFALKKYYDPTELFTNNFYEKYKN